MRILDSLIQYYYIIKNKKCIQYKTIVERNVNQRNIVFLPKKLIKKPASPAEATIVAFIVQILK